MKTKSLPKTLMALVALTVCLTFAPITTQAQHSVPYHTTVGGDHLPSDWIADYGGIYYQGWEYYAFRTGTIILPEFNVPTNTLTVDVRVQPFYDPPFGSTFEIGYLTDVNNLNSFVTVQLFSFTEESWTDDWRYKRAVLSNVPADARIAFYAYYPWFISEVYVYETPDPFDVPYSTNSSGWGSFQPDGWYANNWMCNWFRSGVAALPRFTSALNTLQLDISLKPRMEYMIIIAPARTYPRRTEP